MEKLILKDLYKLPTKEAVRKLIDYLWDRLDYHVKGQVACYRHIAEVTGTILLDDIQKQIEDEDKNKRTKTTPR